MVWYVAHIANQDGRFAVSFPDAPAVRVVHETLEDALDLGAQALGAQIKAWRAKGISPRAPTPLSAMSAEDQAGNCALVEIAEHADDAQSRLAVRMTSAANPRVRSANTR